MVDVRNEKDLGRDAGGAGEGVNPCQASPSTAERKLYHPPRLRHLGSVRELTAGSGNNTSDGVGFKDG